MLIIPAIDLKDGACVRLEQGRMESATVFSKEPAKAAAQWAAKGAKRLHVVDLAKRFQDYGVEAVIYTDIGRDGMMTGVNIEATVRLAKALTVPVIASGGLSSLDDVRKLLEVEGEGITGCITGRAIYEGKLDFAAAQKVAAGEA